MPDLSTSSGVTLLLLPALFLALKLWGAYVGKRVLRTFPYCPDVFTIVAADDVAGESRDILEAQSVALVALGFQPGGYLRVTDDLTPDPRTRLVLRHQTERTFALVGFGALGGELGIVCDLLTLCEDGTWVRTQNGIGYSRLGIPTSEHFNDAVVATFLAEWESHRAACAAAPPPAEAPDLTTLVAHLNEGEAEVLRNGLARGEIAMEGSPLRAMKTTLGVRRAVERFTTGIRLAAAAKLAQGDFKAMRLPVEEQARFFAELTLARELRRRAASPWLVLGLTAAGFALSTFLTMDLTWVVLLMPALLFHELGHWAVMRLCGHRDARVAFVPFLGAVTMTQKPFARPWQEVAMLLAGPLPGLVLGLVLATKGASHEWPRVMHAGLMLVGLNALNLLPLHPLDGGRIFHVLVAAGRPLLDLALRAIATLVFLGVAVSLGDPVLGLVGLAGIFVLRAGYRNLALEKSIRAAPDFDAQWPEEERRRRIFAALSASPHRALGPWFETALALDLQIRTRRPPLLQSLFWSGALAAAVGGVVYMSHIGAGIASDIVACPPIENAKPVACDAAALASIPWGDLGAGERAPSSASELRHAGFVWCESGDQETLGRLSLELEEAATVGAYCGSLPWEAPDLEAADARKHARQTLSFLLPGSEGSLPRRYSTRLDRMDQFMASVKNEPWFDADTARLVRALADPSRADKDQLRRSLVERIGPSPTGSCHRLVIKNVQTQFAQEPADGGSAGDQEEPPMTGIRVSAGLASPADFAPLGAYLCKAGCRLRITPRPSGAADLLSCI